MDSAPQNLQMYKYVSIISGIGTLISSLVSCMLLYLKNQSAAIFILVAIITLIICLTCYHMQKHSNDTEVTKKEKDNQAKRADNKTEIQLTQIKCETELQLKEKDIELAQIDKEKEIELAKINKEKEIELAKIQAGKYGGRPHPPPQFQVIK